MNAPWHIDRLLRPRAGQDGHLHIVDAGDGPHGRTVCVIPGHLELPVTPRGAVRLLDERDVENARLLAAAPQLRAAVAALLRWSASTGGWDAPCWHDAHDLMDRLRNPYAAF